MITVDNLSRVFTKGKLFHRKKFTAVDQVSFNVGDGTVFGLLGPNGAGKTTIVRMLACLIRPTIGEATIDGLSILNDGDRHKIRSLIGLTSEHPNLYKELTAWQNLVYIGRFYHIDEKVLEERIERYAEMFGILDKLDEPVSGYSKGMKQKIIVTRALLHDPRYVFLDEPTSGLDPISARTTREIITGLKKDGKTVILCTHNLYDASRLCDKVGIIKSKLLYYGDPNMDKQRSTITIETTKNDASLVTLLNTVPGVHGVTLTENGVDVDADNPDDTVQLIVNTIVSAGVGVKYVAPKTTYLEDIYCREVEI